MSPWTPRPSQSPCHRHKRFDFKRLGKHSTFYAPFLCTKRPSRLFRASFGSVIQP
ncbi:Unknown protein sequence [Pseudomonas amygdali pv. morsprunorum]|nr:Unknown protein sequence [Pseudomonas amygdali pv. morsprunorum]